MRDIRARGAPGIGGGVLQELRGVAAAGGASQQHSLASVVEGVSALHW